jgi:hypothetical protein
LLVVDLDYRDYLHNLLLLWWRIYLKVKKEADVTVGFFFRFLKAKYVFHTVKSYICLMNPANPVHIMRLESLPRGGDVKELKRMADGLKGLADGFGTFFATNGWLMFLIFVLLVIGCGGCWGGCI